MAVLLSGNGVVNRRILHDPEVFKENKRKSLQFPNNFRRNGQSAERAGAGICGPQAARIGAAGRKPLFFSRAFS
ncbi:hypothetical protein ACFORG_12370 [Lutimaribacter marinistellae]|uniref:Uncharacterized protein n=1 Tax=Lutimaribacter marinistellae TaxID=1820329 RepID=A0ABV7TL66_9RHOB